MKTVGILATALLATSVAEAGIFTIGGIVFDDTNAVTTAMIVEGPANIRDYRSPLFARYSETYATSPTVMINEFQSFDHSRSIGRLMGRGSNSGMSRHITLPDAGPVSELAAMPNVNRSCVELTWGEKGLPNGPGDDLAIFEVAVWEGITVSVRKAGATEFSPARYHFPQNFNTNHNVNPVTFDLSKFGLAENEVIAAVRIRNIFNSKTRSGGDKVDDSSGQGFVVYPGDPRYKTAFPLLNRAGGTEFNMEQLGADLVYAVGLHDVIPLPKTESKSAAIK